MKFRRHFLLSGLLAFALAGINVHAQDNVLRVGTDATFPPMEFVENDKRTGFDIELLEAMAKAMGKRVEWVDIDFKGLIPGLVAKRFTWRFRRSTSPMIAKKWWTSPTRILRAAWLR